ncbi:hypothetical protein [Paenibacillus sp. TSA_86.1]|uniref:hypothetical protein n=1 Tax=Paenibacillus sp. TSA_86.1 TaxID=3415649 RepID=UPI004045B088
MKIHATTERENLWKPLYVFLSVMIGLTLFSFGSTAHAAVLTDRLAPAAVEQYAQQQASVLGTSNSDWLTAQLEYYPLGPGTHGWLVYANVQDQRIGYMIISITEQGKYFLSEYGQGEEVLYNNELLGQALERQQLNLSTIQTAGGELTRRYAAPLLAYWKVGRANYPALYIDASNGDLLPSDVLERLEKSPGTQSSAPPKLQELQAMPAATTWITDPVRLRPAFGPSLQLTWLTSEPLQLSQVKERIQNSHLSALVFSAGERNLFYGGPLPVSGYQMWHTQQPEAIPPIQTGNKDRSGLTTGTGKESASVLYVGLGGFDSTQRFVPLNKLLLDGHFYMINL